MKPQAPFFQDCFFICPSTLLPNFMFVNWILLKILSFTADPKPRFLENFLNFALFWCKIELCFILMHNALFWLAKMINNTLFWLVSINKGNFESNRGLWYLGRLFFASYFLFLLGFPYLEQILNRRHFNCSQNIFVLSNMVLIWCILWQKGVIFITFRQPCWI